MTLSDYKKIPLPEAPGVYVFRDASDNILYIGKATSLKDRVRSYFAPDLNKTRGLKIVSMVVNAHTVTWQETPSVLEAILLETNLIKKYKPVFNTKEKDDKSYNCVVVTKEDFPRVLVLRTRNVLEDMKKDIAYTFGPFASSQALRDTMKIIRKIFPFRDTCIPNTGKPCFNAQIGLCPGVCTGTCSKDEYRKIVRNLVSFFKGNREEILKRLTKDMQVAAVDLQFEKAHEIKKTIFSLTHIRDSMLIKHTQEELISNTKSIRIEGYDVAHISGTNRVGVMVVLENGEPQKAGYRKFKLPEKINDDYVALREMLTRRFTHTEWRFPDLIVIDGGPGQMNVAKEVLSDYKLTIPLVSVVKNAAHKPDHFLGEHKFVEMYKQEILLTNSESHRFAMSYHTQLRNKNFLSLKDKFNKKNETK
ncbi:MAG: GIY-YIG nuclease family protein [Minisyncoccia bacterium]